MIHNRRAFACGPSARSSPRFYESQRKRMADALRPAGRSTTIFIWERDNVYIHAHIEGQPLDW